jgi:hypothetical protein
MSLNIAQRRATRAEFSKNVELLGLAPADMAAALGVDAISRGRVCRNT